MSEVPTKPTKVKWSPGRWAVIVAIAGWLLMMGAMVTLSGGEFPLHIHSLEHRAMPFWTMLGLVQGSLVLAGVIIALALWVTRHRPKQNLAERAPRPSVAAWETLGMIVYAVAGQVAGFYLGHSLGAYAISLHMPGTLYGLSGAYTPQEAVVWAAFNFVVYAVIPFLFFRWRGYTNEQLNLKTQDLKGDLWLIAVVFVVEATVELLSISSAIFSLNGSQMLWGSLLTFALNFFGTVLPILIFIYAILLPRFLRLTNSVVLTTILCGVSYALVHIFDSWTDYSTLSSGVLSAIFVVMQYFGPGMVKAVLTLRTGNAWVHAWAYHIFDPHVLIDTPTIVGVFRIR